MSNKTELRTTAALKLDVKINEMKPGSTIRSTDQKDLKDRYGYLSKGLLPANTVTMAYGTSQFTEYVNIYLNITNDSPDPVDIQVWISDKREPEREDILETSIPLDGKLTYLRGPILVGKGEKVFLRATTGNVVYRISGYDERKL